MRGFRLRTGDRRTRLVAAVGAGVLIMFLASVGLEAAGGQPPIQQDEFVPIDELPPQDQLPAAPLLVAAYALVWLIVMGYLWTIRKRLSTVEREIGDLARRSGAGGDAV